MDHDSTNNSDDSNVSGGYFSDQFSPNSKIYNNGVAKSEYNKPYLEVLEQPRDFRYRYEKEKYHGHITGLTSPTNKKRCSYNFPVVKIYNYDRDVIVRCWLISTDLTGTPKAHFHKLNRKLPKGKLKFEPHDILLTQKNSHVATIIIKKVVHFLVCIEKDKEDLELYDIKKGWLESGEFNCPHLSSPQSNDEALREVNKNQSRLLFQAFDAETKEKICESFSRKINNLHNPTTSALKIVNYSLTSGSCRGGDEVFMLFEKISKDVEVRVFSCNNYGTRMWDEKTIYSNSSIHHQCAIVFKTPPYMNTKITSPVTAYFELYRKSDGARSEPKKFTYQPHEHCNKKNFVEKRPHPNFTANIKEDPIKPEVPLKKRKGTCGATVKVEKEENAVFIKMESGLDIPYDEA